MTIRRPCLPPGWYPKDEKTIRKLLESWTGQVPESGARAALAPHAGWAFSGRLAARALAALDSADTLVILGGHLPGFSPTLAALEDGFETPLGTILSDGELRSLLARKLAGLGGLKSDDGPDNTVEVHLPLVKLLFPDIRLLWLRAPNGPASILLGKTLAETAQALGKNIVCLASTDLSHYGPAYGFCPKGRGPEAEAWVRTVNDRAFIDALLAMDEAAVIAAGEGRSAACSSGAAAAALSFAKSRGANKARLLGYATSLDTRRDESFVGYAAAAFYE